MKLREYKRGFFVKEVDDRVSITPSKNVKNKDFIELI